MRRRRVLQAAGGALGGLGGCTFVPRRTETGCTYRNPVYEASVFPDPSVVRAPDGRYYACATYHVWGDDADRPLVPVVRSPDLVDWTAVGAAFRTRPDWKRGGVWAPDIARHDGRYLLYYSLADWDDPNPGIGVAVSETPDGPFADRGELLRSEAVGVPNSIDPFFVVDQGRPHLLWGSHRGIFGARLAPDGLSLAGDPVRLAGAGVEAAALRRRGDHYYLFVSAGTCCAGAESTYRVVVGRASTLAGPYLDPAGDELAAGHGATVVRGDERFAGPGHADVVRDAAGADWLLHHAYERTDPWAGETPRRVLLLSPLVWRDGWPAVSGRAPPREARCPEPRA